MNCHINISNTVCFDNGIYIILKNLVENLQGGSKNEI